MRRMSPALLVSALLLSGCASGGEWVEIGGISSWTLLAALLPAALVVLLVVWLVLA